MSRGKYLFLAVVLFLTYAAGIALFVYGILSSNVLFDVLGVACCGLPTAITFLFVANTIFGRPRRTRNSNSSGLRFVLFLVGLVLGLIVTPIMIVWFCVAAAKVKAQQNGQEQPQQIQQ